MTSPRPRRLLVTRLTKPVRGLAACALAFATFAALRCAESANSQTADGDEADSQAPGGNGLTRAAVDITLQGPDTMARDSVAELPRATVDARYVAPTGQTIRVGERGNLQSALNRAKPGDVVALAPGATYVGNFVIPAKRCGTPWITIRTDIADSLLPPEGQRITPAASARLAKIATPNQVPAIKTAIPTCGWRLMGLEVTVLPSFTELNYGMIWFGDGGWREGGDFQSSAEKIPADIVLDRVYLHGQASTASMRCLALNSARTAIVNSWLSDCHAKGTDSQAIAGWNGPGPYLIENNFIQGATENLIFGGADPGIHGLVPSDITIRRNHFHKDPAWKGKWTVKNLFELKNAQRVLIEGNVFENNWADGQEGMAIVIKSQIGRETGPNLGLWQGTTDVTFRYNIVRNSPRGFNLQAVGDGGSNRMVAHVRAENNLFENIGTFNGTGGDGWEVLLTHPLRDVKISHNTFVHNLPKSGMALYLAYADGGTARNIVITDNVFTSPLGYAIGYADTKAGTESIKAYAGTTWKFERNVVAGVEPQYASSHPPGNWYPPTVAGIGFVNPEAGEYRLGNRTAYKGRGEGGRDPGVDLARLRRETDGVVVR